MRLLHLLPLSQVLVLRVWVYLTLSLVALCTAAATTSLLVVTPELDTGQPASLGNSDPQLPAGPICHYVWLFMPQENRLFAYSSL